MKFKKREMEKKSVPLNAGCVCDEIYWHSDVTGLDRKSGYVE